MHALNLQFLCIFSYPLNICRKFELLIYAKVVLQRAYGDVGNVV